MQKVVYEVWALGYDVNNNRTDIEEFLGEFPTKEQAIEQANKVTCFDDIYDPEVIVGFEPGDYMEIRVEKLGSILSPSPSDLVYSFIVKL